MTLFGNTDDIDMSLVTRPIPVEILGETYTFISWTPDLDVFSDDVAIDTETEPIVPGTPIEVVLMQVYSGNLCHIVPRQYIQIYLRRLFAKERFISMHNSPFDTHVLGMFNPASFLSEFHKDWVRVIESDRLIDIAIRFLLRGLAEGSYIAEWNLDYISQKLLGISMGKRKKKKLAPTDEDFAEDSDNEEERIHKIRMGYRRGMVLKEEHVLYAGKDAVHTGLITRKMPDRMPTEEIQLMGFMALSQISRNGLLVDIPYMRELRSKYQSELNELLALLNLYGYFPGVSGNQTVLQELLANLEDRTKLTLPKCAPQTKKDGTVTTKYRTGKILLETLGDAKHPFFESLVRHDHCQKMVTTYMNEDLVGVDSRVHPFFAPLVRTGRTSCSRPNIQNLPRKGDIRGIYLPPPGYLLYSSDYNQVELCALAQTCLERYGKSVMAEVINSGQDIHIWFGKIIAREEGVDPDSMDEKAFKKKYRQMAKCCNFGYPGGLAPATLKEFAKQTYGVFLTQEQCVKLGFLWKEAFPEMKEHLRPKKDPNFGGYTVGYIDEWDDEDQPERYIASTINGRIRRNSGYCAACNYSFQGLTADGAKIALWLCIQDGMYNEVSRYKVVNFIHDELIIEVREDEYLQQTCKRIDALMLAGMKSMIPDVLVKVEGALMRRWHKDAEPVFNEAGELIPWEPKPKKE